MTWQKTWLWFLHRVYAYSFFSWPKGVYIRINESNTKWSPINQELETLACTLIRPPYSIKLSFLCSLHSLFCFDSSALLLLFWNGKDASHYETLRSPITQVFNFAQIYLSNFRSLYVVISNVMHPFYLSILFFN
jgi:hypothetical protein